VSNGTPIIEARELHTYYGASHILHGIDLSVGAGEATGLMGRNGMGKTTLIRTLVGHVAPRSRAMASPTFLKDAASFRT